MPGTQAPVTIAHSTLTSTSNIIADIRAGRMVVVIDDEDRENEGDLVIAAEFATAQAISFMAVHGRGLICLALTKDRCERLELPMMTSREGARPRTNFTVSIDAAEGITTGISAHDRARTVRAAIRPDAVPSDVVLGGHVFPLLAAREGVLERPGHTEAACDLAALAGLSPAGVICEIMKDDGEMARLPDLLSFAERHGLHIGTIADLIAYRRELAGKSIGD